MNPKLLSGRLIATVAICAVYIYASVTGVIDPQNIQEMTIMVISFYFLRNREP